MRALAAVLLLSLTVTGCYSPEVHRGLTYEPTIPGATFDVYEPGQFAKGHGKKNRPAIIAIHGGGWQGGDKSWGESVAERYVPQGYVVFAINYRLAPQARWPAQIEDCQAALRYVCGTASNWGVDPTRIGAFGHSAGGHLAAMLALRGPDRVRAAVTANGEGDLTVLGSEPIMDREVELLEALLGPRPWPPGTLEDLSPVTFARPDAAVLVIHSVHDPNVFYPQGVRLHDALAQVGADTGLVTVDGGCHNRCWQEDEPMRRASEFFRRHLADKEN